MKTKIFTILVMAIGLLASTSAFAQPTATTAATSDSNADAGSTITYTLGTATGTNAFTWVIRPQVAGNTGTTPTITASGTNSQQVNWTGTKGGDIYYLDVYYRDNTGCYSEMLTYKVSITEGDVQYATTNEDVVTCSDLASSKEGGDTSDESSDQISMNVVFNGTDNLASVAYQITYASNYYDNDLGSPSASAVTLTTTNVSAKTGVITINSDFENTTTSDIIFTVTIVSATTTNGAMIVPGTNKASTLTVKAKPTISFTNN